MKVYIVTNGSYDEYIIEKVFSNRPAAEEYKKWRNIKNDIEEYEVHNEPFEKVEGEKVMFIRAQCTVYPEAIVNLRFEIRRDIVNSDRVNYSGRGIMKYREPGVFTLHSYSYVSADLWDEEKYKNRLTESLYSLASVARAMLAEGASVGDVEQALYNMEDAVDA